MASLGRQQRGVCVALDAPNPLPRASKEEGSTFSGRAAAARGPARF